MLTTLAADSAGIDTNGVAFKIALAAISVVVGGVVTLVTDRIKRRNDPHKQLSWDARTEIGLARAEDEIAQHLGITYKGRPVQDLAVIDCTISNTGNRVVKNELIRFAVPEGAVIVEAACRPRPQREMKVSRDTAEEESDQEAVFRIGHIEKGASITVRLLATGQEARNWTVVAHNDEGDVGFHSREVARVRDDREHVAPFTKLLILFFTVPPIFGLSLFGPIGDLVQAAAWFLIAVLLMPHVTPTARLVQNFLTSRAPDGRSNPSVVINGSVQTIKT
ncbi:hypothetical protein [Amycolatopsis sp. cmx-4-83]|uniref:hypothetical protein n=1 Tax=Amycolatopsis sp. cmx-4-83 TaxID=2790940 RepID=UPI00397E115D